MTSLLDGLRLIKDSRSRHGRIYPLWGILALLILAAGILEEALRPWLPSDQAYAADGKVLRGSKRAGQRALEVLTLVGQAFGQVLA